MTPITLLAAFLAFSEVKVLNATYSWKPIPLIGDEEPLGLNDLGQVLLANGNSLITLDSSNGRRVRYAGKLRGEPRLLDFRSDGSACISYVERGTDKSVALILTKAFTKTVAKLPPAYDLLAGDGKVIVGAMRSSKGRRAIMMTGGRAQELPHSDVCGGGSSRSERSLHLRGRSA